VRRGDRSEVEFRERYSVFISCVDWTPDGRSCFMDRLTIILFIQILWPTKVYRVKTRFIQRWF